MFLFNCSSNCLLRSDPIGITGFDLDKAIFLRLRDIISKRKHVGKVLNVKLKEFQRHAFKPKVMHMDFIRV